MSSHNKTRMSRPLDIIIALGSSIESIHHTTFKSESYNDPMGMARSAAKVSDLFFNNRTISKVQLLNLVGLVGSDPLSNEVAD